MPNPHYKAGVNFEREVMKVLEEHFPEPKHIIVRTAGSHSPLDVIIMKRIGEQGVNRSFGIQCKTRKEKKGKKINWKVAEEVRKYHRDYKKDNQLNHTGGNTNG